MADIRAPWMDGWMDGWMGRRGGDFDSETASFYTRLLLNSCLHSERITPHDFVDGFDRRTDGRTEERGYFVMLD